MNATTALQSLAMVGVASGSVRSFRPSGSGVVIAYCVRNGEALHGCGPDLATACERLATAAMLAAMQERGERQMVRGAA